MPMFYPLAGVALLTVWLVGLRVVRGCLVRPNLARIGLAGIIVRTRSSGWVWMFLFYGEFDPGSGRTLVACLTHASRTVMPSLLGGSVANG